MTDMLAKAKELNEKRTQGKWRHGIHGFHDFVICENEEVVSEDASPYDSRFIAFAPEFFDWAIKEIWKLNLTAKGEARVGTNLAGANETFLEYIDKLEGENTKLRTALEWYADPEQYINRTSGIFTDKFVLTDNGQKAREALK